MDPMIGKDSRDEINSRGACKESLDHYSVYKFEAFTQMNLGNEYSQVAKDEIKLLHQKAKIRWLEEGDRNTSYFHNILKARKHKSRIESICCEDGKRVEGSLVNDQFVQNFQTFRGSSFHVSPLSSLGDIALLKLTETEATDMIKDVSDKEIKEALFDINSSKVVGPDGYTSCFFKKAWNIIGTDICLAVREFVMNGKIFGEINATLVALVPKLDTPNKEIKLTHMCFADDLMVLCNGDTDSLLVVKKTLDEFSSVSCLFHNLNKSTIFFGSLNEIMKEDMQKILPFKCGKLPMRYLGVPLLAKRLGGKDYQIAILIASCPSTATACNIRHSLHSSFNVIVRSSRKYFNSSYGILVDVRDWNPSGLIKGKARVKWVNTVKLKGKSIWEAECTDNDSHGWKELMKIRDKIKPFVTFKIGNGKYISVWHDKWCDIGPLDKVIQSTDVYDARMINLDCLADAICDGRWKWTDEWKAGILS
ncbi:RNA-directed DNA polymerase, eukaryota, reverse transcriptase zinc-binding domain protein [Tanacetum coccineum]